MVHGRSGKMANAEYDTTYWPLAVLVLPQDVTTLEIEPLDRSLQAIFARKQRFLSLTDASAVASLPDAKGRNAIAAWTKSIEAQTQQLVVANSLVIKSPIARGVLTAIQWVAPPVVPTIAASTAEEACAFLRDIASRSALDLTALDRYLAARRRR